MRTTSGACPRTGMQSTLRTVPWSVTNTVSSTRVPGRYDLDVRSRSAPIGAIRHNPFDGSPSNAAKHAAEDAKLAAEKTADAIQAAGKKAVEATEQATEEGTTAGADAVEASQDAVPK